MDFCRAQETKEGVMATDAFTSVLKTLGASLQSDGVTKLLTIYDKKAEGVVNYDDFISEQKYIHAVSQHYRQICLQSCNFTFTFYLSL